MIDYRGYRVTAQSIIPGILEREQEQSVVYGSIDFGKTVVTHPKYLELLGKAGQQLKVFQHSVLNDKDEEVELCSSVECKGIIGNDGRHYILDLLRTFPPDVNFLKIEGEELSKEARALGFPVEHKHKLCCLRQELVDAFVESRYMLFIKYAAFHLQQVGLKKQKTASERSGSVEKEVAKVDESEISASGIQTIPAIEKGTEEQQHLDSDEAKKIVESITDSITHGEKPDVEESTKVTASSTLEWFFTGSYGYYLTQEIVRKAAAAVGSLKDTEFDIRFNPDVLSPGVRHPEGLVALDRLKKEKQLIKDAADFLITIQIPTFIRDCLDHASAPLDGSTLIEAIHSRGKPS